MHGKTLDDVLGELQRRYGQYKRLEAELQQTRIRLSNQLPDVQRSLEAVVMLCEKRESENPTSATVVKYQLTEATFADAEVIAPESVYLWLGANVMLEYPLDEARELLETNVKACEIGLEANTRDLAVLKDNITIIEVNMARLYNFDVRAKRDAEEGADATKKSDGTKK
jgi:prefoldin subunit 5